MQYSSKAKIGFALVGKRKKERAILMIGLFISASAIAGTLFMADSVNYLTEHAVYRNLGEVDILVSSPRGFNYSIFRSLDSNESVKELSDGIAPLIKLPCPAKNIDTGLFESRISLIGFDERFEKFGSFIALEGNASLTNMDDTCLINEVCAERLQAHAGHRLQVYLSLPSFAFEDIYSGNAEGSMVRKNLSVKAVLKKESLGSIQLNGNIQEEATLFVPLGYIQRILNIPDRINAVVLSCREADGKDGMVGNLERSDLIEKTAEKVWHVLNDTLGLKDANLVTRNLDYLQLYSEDIFFPYEYQEKLSSSSKELKIHTSPVLTYFVNSISANGKSVSYSTVCGFDPLLDKDFGAFVQNGSNKETYGEMSNSEICLNNWTAEKIGAKVGDSVVINYTVLGERYTMTNLSEEFHVRYVINIAGKADDKNLMPEFPGIENIDNCTNWNPPFPIELNRITHEDIIYWQLYRGTPKAFIVLSKAQELWGCLKGNLTAIKIGSSGGGIDSNLRIRVERFLNDSVGTGECNIVVIPLKLQLLRTSGISETNLLFMTFGGVIVIAGTLLFVLTMSMFTEERLKEIGTLRAVGLRRRGLAFSILAGASGLIFGSCILGSVFGLGVGYIFVLSLNTNWSNIIEGTHVQFHPTPESILVSIISSSIISFLALLITAYLLSRTRITVALSQGTQRDERKRMSLSSVLLICMGAALIFLTIVTTGNEGDITVLLLIGPVLILLGAATAMFQSNWKGGRFFSSLVLLLAIIFVLGYESIVGTTASTMVMFVASGFLIVSILSFLLSINFETIERTAMRVAKLLSKPSPSLMLGLSYPSRKRLRSSLTLYMVSLVIFLMITLSIVTAVEKGEMERAIKTQGGGYDIIAECTNPVYFDLKNSSAREKAGIYSSVFDRMNVTQLKSVGQAGSTCTNLNRNLPPKLVAANSKFVSENSFGFVAANVDKKNKKEVWQSLFSSDPFAKRIPAIGDYNTIVWIYGLNVGSSITVIDDSGSRRELEIVGIIDTSIFTGSLFVSEYSLNQLYPKSAGYRFFLFKGVGNLEHAARELERSMSIYGLDGKTVHELVKSSVDTEQSYVEALQVLLGIGLIVGLTSLGILALRTVAERKWDIGIMRSLGIRRKNVSKALLVETCYLLFLGLLIGTLSGIFSSVLFFSSWAGLRFQFIIPWEVIGIIWLVSYTIILTLTLWSSRLASKFAPAEALRRG